jgi:hypothetical protein
MLKSLYLLLLFPIILLTASCIPGQQANQDLKPQFEASAWLESNTNPSALAGNRFGSTAEALAFVKLLYEHGAVGVFVTDVDDEDWRIELEGGPYTDTLIVCLPSEPEKRKAIFEMVNEEAAREGFSPEKDIGQEELLLWWD